MHSRRKRGQSCLGDGLALNALARLRLPHRSLLFPLARNRAFTFPSTSTVAHVDAVFGAGNERAVRQFANDVHVTLAQTATDLFPMSAQIAGDEDATIFLIFDQPCIEGLRIFRRRHERTDDALCVTLVRAPESHAAIARHQNAAAV